MTFNLHQIRHYIRHFFTAKRKGHGIHSPFAYRLCEDVFYNKDSFYRFTDLEKIRARLLNSNVEIDFEDHGAGSKTLKGKKRKIGDIARKGISSRKQAELIYRLLNFMGSKNCVELGTSVGLTTLYFASVNTSLKVITVEGSAQLSNFASQLAKQNKYPNIEFINAKFDDVLQEILGKLESVDFLYVDGNHRREATIAYFETALKYANSNSVFIFDDIYWSREMTDAWKKIQSHPSVKLSIDLFHFGMIFFRNEIREQQKISLFI